MGAPGYKRNRLDAGQNIRKPELFFFLYPRMSRKVDAYCKKIVMIMIKSSNNKMNCHGFLSMNVFQKKSCKFWQILRTNIYHKLWTLISNLYFLYKH